MNNDTEILAWANTQQGDYIEHRPVDHSDIFKAEVHGTLYHVINTKSHHLLFDAGPYFVVIATSLDEVEINQNIPKEFKQSRRNTKKLWKELQKTTHIAQS